MPVPDKFNLADDWGYCEICKKDYPLSSFKHVAVSNGVKENGTEEIRYYALCTPCREKCIVSAKYEQYVTDQVFKLKLGRRIR